MEFNFSYDCMETHVANFDIEDKTFTPAGVIDGLNKGTLRLSGRWIFNLKGDIVANRISDDSLGSDPVDFHLESEHCTKCHSLLDGFSDCPECGSPNLLHRHLPER
jgi:hypothetical protein